MCNLDKNAPSTQVMFSRWNSTDILHPMKIHLYQPGNKSLGRLKYALPTRPYDIRINSNSIYISYDVRPYTGSKKDIVIVKILGELELVNCADRYLPEGTIQRKFYGTDIWINYASIRQGSGTTPENLWIVAQSDYNRWITEHPARALFIKKFHDLTGGNEHTRDNLWFYLKLYDFNPDSLWENLDDIDREAFTQNDIKDLCYLYKFMWAEITESERISSSYNNYLSFIHEH